MTLSFVNKYHRAMKRTAKKSVTGWQDARPGAYENWRKAFEQDAGVAEVLGKLDPDAMELLEVLYNAPRLRVLKKKDMRRIADEMRTDVSKYRTVIDQMERIASPEGTVNALRERRAELDAHSRFLQGVDATYRQVDHLIMALHNHLHSRRVEEDIATLLNAAEIPTDSRDGVWTPAAVAKRRQRFSVHPFVKSGQK